MSAAALILELKERGARLEAAGARLRWSAPRGVLAPADLARLREHKAELLVLLAANDAGTSAGFVPLDPPGDPCGPCLVCGGGAFWRTPAIVDPDAEWRCQSCEPPAPDEDRDAWCLPPLPSESAR